MIYLASKSPRRQELLKMLDVDFRILDGKEVQETYPADMNKEAVPEYLSQLKARAYLDILREGDILITADTIVLLDGEIIGKPKDEKDAKIMLSKLSARTHKVITGVTLASANKSRSFSTETEVSFGYLNQAQIDYYVDKYKPLDKAGAYGIQEWIGAVGVKGLNGSFYNVMGLPIYRVYHELEKFKTC